MKKIIVISLLVIFILILLSVVNAMIKEKFCYNTAFIFLDNNGIKLGEVSPELKNKGIGPLQVGDNPGFTEWNDAYIQCYKNFDLFKINISILEKSYPKYTHFIDY